MELGLEVLDDKEFIHMWAIPRIQDLTYWKETKEMVLIAAKMALGIFDYIMGYVMEVEIPEWLWNIIERGTKKLQKLDLAQYGKNHLLIVFCGKPWILLFVKVIKKVWEGDTSIIDSATLWFSSVE